MYDVVIREHVYMTLTRPHTARPRKPYWCMQFGLLRLLRNRQEPCVACAECVALRWTDVSFD